jgi:hypothetical protein
MISHINYKLLFSNIILKSYHFIIWKYLKIFYFIIWWNLKNLYVKNFKIFFKKYENKFNLFKTFLLLNNNFLFKKIIYSTDFNLLLLKYLNNNFIYLLTKNKNNNLLNFYLNDSFTFLDYNILLKNYSFYYNFYSLFYLNKWY